MQKYWSPRRAPSLYAFTDGCSLYGKLLSWGRDTVRPFHYVDILTDGYTPPPGLILGPSSYTPRPAKITHCDSCPPIANMSKDIVTFVVNVSILVINVLARGNFLELTTFRFYNHSHPEYIISPLNSVCLWIVILPTFPVFWLWHQHIDEFQRKIAKSTHIQSMNLSQQLSLKWYRFFHKQGLKMTPLNIPN